jgi:hypothetical protein
MGLLHWVFLDVIDISDKLLYNVHVYVISVSVH